MAAQLVLGLLPPTSLALQRGAAHGTLSAAQQSPPAGSAVPARATLLTLGSGYGSPHGSGSVRALQRRLVQVGATPGPIDGRYGPLTERAVVRFQAAHRLPVDGIAGPQTMRTLASAAPVLYPGSGDLPGGPRPVRALQRRLVRAGYAPGPIDGRYGPLTERAVVRFQAAHRLPVDGIAGPRTLAGLAAGGGARRQHHTRARPLRSQPHGTHHRSPAPTSRRPGTRARPTPAHPPSSSHARHGSGLSLLVWPLLAGLILVVLLAGVLWRRRRPRSAPSPVQAAPVNAAEPAARTIDPLQRLSDELGAEAALRRADARGDANSAFELGVLLEERRDVAGAKAAYERAEQRGLPAAACNLGVLLGDQGDLGGAEMAFRRADQGGDANAALNLGLLCEQRGDLGEALGAYRRADERGLATAACALGALFEQQGELSGAERAFRRADRRGDAEGAFKLGVLLEDTGDLAGARDAYDRAEQRGLPAAACNLGVLLGEQGDLAGAETAFRRADNAGDATAALNLGVLLEQRGDLTQATAAYHRAVQRGAADVAQKAQAALSELGSATPNPAPQRGGGHSNP